MAIEEVVASAMARRLPAAGPSPAQHVRRAGPPEVPDVDALGAARPGTRGASGWCTCPNSAARGRSRRDHVEQRGRRRPPAAVTPRRRPAPARRAARGCTARRRSPRRATAAANSSARPQVRASTAAAPQGPTPGGSGAPPTNPNRSPPMLDHPPSAGTRPGRGELRPQLRAGRRCRAWRRSATVIAANSRSYCSRTASSTRRRGRRTGDHAARAKPAARRAPAVAQLRRTGR